WPSEHIIEHARPAEQVDQFFLRVWSGEAHDGQEEQLGTALLAAVNVAFEARLDALVLTQKRQTGKNLTVAPQQVMRFIHFPGVGKDAGHAHVWVDEDPFVFVNTQSNAQVRPAYFLPLCLSAGSDMIQGLPSLLSQGNFAGLQACQARGSHLAPFT